MSLANEEITAAGETGIDALAALTSAALDAWERILSLHLHTARALLGDAFLYSESLAAARDFERVLALTAAFSEPLVDRFGAYTRRVCEITARTIEEAADLSETHCRF